MAKKPEEKETKEIKKTTIPRKLPAPPKRQDKFSTLTNGTSKLVRRLGGHISSKPIKSLSSDDVINDTPRTPLDGSPTLDLGSEVQLEYNGVSVTGVIRYVGTTDFSPGKWCGIELTEDVGKHNGTVNGKCYFVCRDSYGVFIRFNKVADKLSARTTSAPVGHTTTTHVGKGTSDMRITVKSKSTSVSVPGDVSAGDVKGGPKSASLSSVSRSGIKSYVKSKKDKNMSTKDIIDELRKEKENGTAKNVVISSFTAPAPFTPVVVAPKSDTTEEPTTPLSDDVIDEVFLFNNLSPTEEESTSSSLDDTMTADCVVDLTQQNPTDGFVGDLESDISLSTSLIPQRSSIPRRRSSLRTSSTDNVAPMTTTTTKSRERRESASTSELNAKTKKPPKDRNLSESDLKPSSSKTVVTEGKTKTPAPFPKVFRSSKRGLEYNRPTTENKPITDNCRNDNSTSKTKTSSSTLPDSSKPRTRSTPATTVSRKPVTSSKSVTSSVTSSVPGKTPTPVMGRKNGKTTTTRSHVTKETTTGDESRDNISRKSSRDGKTRKLLTKTMSKDSERDVGELQNQLKEKSDRIKELELMLNNNSNNNNNNNNNKGFEGLAIVLQYYLKQIDVVRCEVGVAMEAKGQLSVKNDELNTQNQSIRKELQDIMVKLDAAKSRCECVQEDLRTLVVTHEGELVELMEQHQVQEDRLRCALEQEKIAAVEKMRSQHDEEMREEKSVHRNEMIHLTSQHQTRIESMLEQKQLEVEELMSQHEEEMSQTIQQHTTTLDDVNNLHQSQLNELHKRLEATTSESDRRQTVIETLRGDLESDTKVQQALQPYKHLPEELKSLQIILDLRNDEIKNNRVKHMEMQKRVDEFFELQTKFDSVSQENQSLKESLSARTMSERTLSVEHDNLLEKYEKETRKVNRLSMEKEQLMWRNSNPDLAGSLPDVAEDIAAEGHPLRSSGSFTMSRPVTRTHSDKVKRRSVQIPISKSDYDMR